VDGVAAAFRGEVADAGWSTTASSAIQAAIAGDEALTPLARGVECRSRTCRVELVDDGSGRLVQALPMFIHHLGRDLPRVTVDRVEGTGGPAAMVLYMSRRSERGE
jgi:hypothetical protein